VNVLISQRAFTPDTPRGAVRCAAPRVDVCGMMRYIAAHVASDVSTTTKADFKNISEALLPTLGNMFAKR